MVGNEEGNGHQCYCVPGLYILPECWRFITSRVGVPKCRDPALEGEPRADDGDAKDQAAAKAAAEAGLHDPERGRKVLKSSSKDASLGAILSHWLVHGKPPKRHHRPKVVDGGSGIRCDDKEGT